MKRRLAKFLKRAFPLKIYKLIANGFIIVPSYYKSIIDEAELNFNLSLEEDNLKKDFLLMRKYGHILDKGLHRSDVHPGHSKECYHSLSETIKRLSKSSYSSDSTYKWALGKLKKYEELQSNPKGFVPLKGDPIPTNLINYDQFFNLVKSRRSNRTFKKEKVSREIINKIIATSNWASSSCNKQPIEVYTTNDPDLAAECLKCCKGGTGFGDFIPSFWVVTANVRGYVWPSEIFLPTLDASLGTQNMVLAATTFGITGTILSWAQKTKEEESKLRNLLNIPTDCSIIMCIVMGYAQQYFETPLRKELN